MMAVAVKLDFHSHGGTAKAWIDPKNRVIPLEDMMHFEWLRRNAPFIRKAYKGAADMPDFGQMDETPARLWALKAGFTRVNYKKASGTITFETNKQHWTPARQDAVSALVADNIQAIDVAAINVLNDDGSFFKSGAQDVAGIEDVAAKFQAVPLARTDANLMIAEALKRGVWRAPAKSEFGYVEAASLSRLLRMVGDPRQEPADPAQPLNQVTNPQRIKVKVSRPFAILTAFKDRLPPPGKTYEQAEADGTLRDVSIAENRARNRKLLAELNGRKMGAYKLVGFFQNPPAGMSYDEARQAGFLTEPTREESFFVVKPAAMPYDEFTGLVENLAFGPDGEQWAYILSDGQAVWEVSREKRRSLGASLAMPVIEQAYSRMRGHPGQPFVFAGTIKPDSNGLRRWMAAEGLCWFD